MCSIVGLVDKRDEDVGELLKRMLDLTEHRGPDGAGMAIGTAITRGESVEGLDPDLPGAVGFGHSRLRITGTTGIQPLYSCDRRFVLGFNGEIWNYRVLRKSLQQNGHVFQTDADSEVVIRLVEQHYKTGKSFRGAVSAAYTELDGEFAFVVYDATDQVFALVRDSVGVKQLYYGVSDEFAGFCSEKKPLWDLGLTPVRVLPGEIVEMSVGSGGQGPDIEVHSGHELKPNRITHFDEQRALDAYRKALFSAVEKRIRDQDRIGIIFSGGVDSVMIAQIARQLGAGITCYTGGFEDSSDVINAMRVAEDLDFEIHANTLTDEKIDRELERIITAIESSNHLQVDVAIPIYSAVNRAREDGIRVMLTGQGADELFAGYPWYPDVLQEKGPDGLNAHLWNDIRNLYKDTLEREDKITMYHSIELRVPFLDPEVIEAAMSVSTDLKIRDDELKYIHRKLAAEIGIPDYISWRPKEAAQHGSNVHAALKKVVAARQSRLEPVMASAGNGSGNGEALGSAYRYAHDVYEGNEEIQSTLDRIGADIGIH